MNPFHPDFRQSKNPATKKEVEQRSAKALFDMIVDAAQQDKKQGEILSKYSSPEEFCRKCTKEEYNFLKMMFRIGSLVNNNIFDYPQENQYLMEMIDQNHLEDFYVKLKTTAYNFAGLDNYMRLVSNNNYAFIDSKTLDMLTKADNQSMAKAQADHPSTNQTINGNKRISLRLQARAARGSSDQVRIGKSYDTRRQKDKDQFATDMKEKKWQRQIDMMKK